MALKKPSWTVGDAGEFDVVAVVRFLGLAVFAGEGFAMDVDAELEVELGEVEAVLALVAGAVEFEPVLALDEEMEEGLVGEMAGVALGEAVDEDDEDVASSVAGYSALRTRGVEAPLLSLSSVDTF